MRNPPYIEIKNKRKRRTTRKDRERTCFSFIFAGVVPGYDRQKPEDSNLSLMTDDAIPRGGIRDLGYLVYTCGCTPYLIIIILYKSISWPVVGPE